MLTHQYKVAFGRLVDPLARGLARLGVSPSMITIGGLGLVAASCLYLVITRRILVFCVLVTLATLCDALDGAVARAGKQTTRFGSYLDAMCDRYGESLVILSVAWVTGYWLLSLLALSGALLTSYAKARAAMEVQTSNTEWPDLMERTERDALYIAGLAAGRLWPVTWFGHDLFWWTLAVFSALTHLTVWQRMLRAKRLITERGTR